MAQSYEVDLFTLSFEAGEDLSSDQHKFGKLAADGQVNRADSAGEKVIGVLQDDDADAAGKAVSVRLFGVTKCVAGGSHNEHDAIATDANGKGVSATAANVDTTTSNSSQDVAGDYVAGYALEPSGGADELFALLLTHSALV